MCIRDRNRTIHCAYKVGCHKFDEVVKSAAFEDKTLLIKEFFNMEHILITAPCPFGKSVNMDLIKKFSEVVVDKNGQGYSEMRPTIIYFLVIAF